MPYNWKNGQPFHPRDESQIWYDAKYGLGAFAAQGPPPQNDPYAYQNVPWWGTDGDGEDTDAEPEPPDPSDPQPPWNPGPATPPGQTKPGAPPKGGGGDEGGGPEWTYESPPYGGPYRPVYNFEDVPQFDAPEFNAPSYEDALNEPGYRFRLDESLKALQRSAAAKGVLRGGGTLSGIAERAGNMASAEYGNVWNRALQSFETTYRGAKDEYLPNLLEWQTLTAAEQRAGDLEWQRYWDAFVYGRDDEWRREHMVYTTP